MKNKETVEKIGTISFKDIDVVFSGQFEIHVQLEEIDDTINRILEECMSKYAKKYPDIDTEKDALWDFKLIYTAGLDNPEYSEFMADVYIWQEENDDTVEIYEGYVLELTDESKRKIKQIIWKNMKHTLFDV